MNKTTITAATLAAGIILLAGALAPQLLGTTAEAHQLTQAKCNAITQNAMLELDTTTSECHSVIAESTTTAVGDAPRVVPIQALKLTESLEIVYDLTGIAHRRGGELTFTLFAPNPSMLSPISEYASAEAASNHGAMYTSAYLPETNGGYSSGVWGAQSPRVSTVGCRAPQVSGANR